MNQIRRSWVIPIITICLVVLFHKWLEELFTTMLVTPLLSKVQFAGSFPAQAALLTLLGLTINWGYHKLKKDYLFSGNWLLWSVFLSIAYLYYRIDGSVWQFYPYWTAASIAATDAIFLIPLYFLIVRITESIRSRRKQKRDEAQVAASNDSTGELLNNGFRHDTPLIIHKSRDQQDRLRFVEQIKDTIIHTAPGESSFCIGVVGTWGSGKTTFLKSLMEEFHTDPAIIQLSFDPWINPESGTLTEHFLYNLSASLAQETDILGSSLEKYARRLVQTQQSNIWSMGAQVLLPFVNWRMSTVEELKVDIGDALRKLNRKIVVFMDDIDRLDQEEVQEVFRLIRNVAGFSNIFYIVAFDKLQVESALKDQFAFGYDRYLEKIFQVEFYLPPIKGKALLNELVTELAKRLNNKDKEVLVKMFKEPDWGDLNTNYEWMERYLIHYRDINRYLNHFDLHYTFVRGEVYLPDFMVMMLLRLKYPDFYYYLYKNSSEFLSFKDTQSESLDDRGVLVLKCENKDGYRVENTVLSKTLEQGRPALGIRSGDKAPLNILFHIFDTNWKRGMTEQIPRLRNGYKSHLSPIYSQYFFRYFDYSFSGRLSDVDFEDALNADKATFLKKIDEWCTTKVIGNEVVESLERFTNFPNFELFDKVTSALMHIALGDFNGQEYIIDPWSFLRQFSRFENKVPNRIFATDVHAKSYMLDILASKCIVGNWCYNLIVKAADEVDNPYYASSGELSEILDRTLAQYFSTKPQIDDSFCSCMLDWIRAAKAIGKEDPLPEIRQYFQDNIAAAIFLFIGPCHIHMDEGNYRWYSDWIRAFFESEEQFFDEVRKVSPEFANELNDFIQKVKGSSTKCASYVFQYLPVPKIEG